MSAPDLQTLQEWMSILIQHPTNCTEGARTPEATALIPTRGVMAGDVIAPSDRMPPLERLDIYGRGYLARLEECLVADFPGLQYAMGEHSFHHLAAAYVQRYPSRHSNLNFFGERLVGFLTEFTEYEHNDFFVELATLEWAMTKTFHAPAFEPFDMASLSDLALEAWGGAVFTANPSLSLHAFEFPTNQFLQDFFEEKEPQIPERGKSFLNINRQDYKTWRSQMTEPAHKVLNALIRGKPFSDALALAGDASQEVGAWFQDWSASDLFTKVTIAS